MNSRTNGSVILLFLCAGWMACLFGDTKVPDSVWDGIYSAEQAARGEAAYAEACASCHGDKLEGQGQAPPLTGPEFASNWYGSNVGELFEKIQVSMPADKPGLLSKEKNAEIVAYILKFNQFPAGPQEMPATAAALKGIRIEAKRAAK